MTATIREELANVASSCEQAIVGLRELEDQFSADFKDVDSLIKGFDWTRGNRPATSGDARSLAVLVKKAIDGNKMNVELTRILTRLVFRLSLLVQQDWDMAITKPDEAKSDLATWFRQWESANKSWGDLVD